MNKKSSYLKEYFKRPKFRKYRREHMRKMRAKYGIWYGQSEGHAEVLKRRAERDRIRKINIAIIVKMLNEHRPRFEILERTKLNYQQYRYLKQSFIEKVYVGI